MSGGQGFSRRQRLLKAAEFEVVFAQRCAVRTSYFQVMARPNDLGHPRLGMVVSKRLFPNAVDRNRIRRRIREVFRHLSVSFPPLDLIVRPQAAPPNISAQEVQQQDLLNAFSKAAERCYPAC